jgi:hypothetical protein
MDLNIQIIEILSANQKPQIYKSDSRIKNAVIRSILELVTFDLLKTDSKGLVLGKNISTLNTLSNYDTLNLLESAIISFTFITLDEYVVNLIKNIDYLGQCWYTPQEMAKQLELKTLHKHNKEKVRRLLDGLVKEGICIKMTDKKFNKNYRLIYTYKG